MASFLFFFVCLGLFSILTRVFRLVGILCIFLYLPLYLLSLLRIPPAVPSTQETNATTEDFQKKSSGQDRVRKVLKTVFVLFFNFLK